ncbi:MAG: TIGR03960 family B12-binding radical SAM protein [Smithella sp.]|nr:TIGR03960 family B12-binding radical SAM protein [Smithella sp.]MDM7988811.1 TIGR03960 family B12-binding radical SAM protein [Smithella sp.]HOU50334.1 TIGR03960 family B12-binding radical SAM protein [Smithella sp.]HQG66900.1 TIGR03960 family B12-binding radical SAM protein [Smithella sp.]HQI72750.1 TIGR03960 family B12-binding radical SAM protein [Smithella sp.]
MSNVNFDELLLGAEKPSRYIGAEVNAVHKDQAEVRFLLAFPDTYEVGMSHLGLQILYSILNEISYVAAERCFAVWPDRERQLRAGKLPLTSLESQTPLQDFDLIGFSLQYELSYTNMLNMLDLGNIPLAHKERKAEHPLIIAGGPCCFNPAPLVNFIDAFVIGEGEEVVEEITAAIREGKKKSLSRNNLIEQLAKISGIYVPAVHENHEVIKKRTVSDLNLWKHPLKPVVPLMQTIHDRITLEIARGCTRGCRFCQAGMLWRPYRERNTSLLMEMAESTLQATGHEEISLLSLSSGDYSCIEPLVQNLMNKYHARRVAVALPSLRVESLNTTLMEEIKRTRKTSFTLAPEAGTDKMRLIINKGNTSAELLATVDKIFSAGWKSIKLYFMIGLPHETQEDLEGIVHLGYEALRAAKNRGQVTISLSTFVPKPHTPFQWERQISMEETYAHQNFIRQRIKNRNLSVKWHDANMSLLEGIFSRGDESIGALLETAFRKGCRFDGWSEILRFDLWQEAMAETGINPADFLRERKINEQLPWDNIDCGVSREYLLEEKQKSEEQKATQDCRFADCQNCGVCDFATTQNIFAVQDEIKTDFSATPVHDASPVNEKKYRFTFSKTGRAGFLSHLELSAAIVRALRRSSFELAYTIGFHPHPKVSFATATSVGMESAQEYMDITGQDYSLNLNSLKKEINALLPTGIEILEIRKLSAEEKAIAQALKGFAYELHLPADMDSSRLKAMEENIRNFLASTTFNIHKVSKGKTIIKDIRPFVLSLTLNDQHKKIIFAVPHLQEGSARPIDIITHILKSDADESRRIRVVRTKCILG